MSRIVPDDGKMRYDNLRDFGDAWFKDGRQKIMRKHEETTALRSWPVKRKLDLIKPGG